MFSPEPCARPLSRYRGSSCARVSAVTLAPTLTLKLPRALIHYAAPTGTFSPEVQLPSHRISLVALSAQPVYIEDMELTSSVPGISVRWASRLLGNALPTVVGWLHVDDATMYVFACVCVSGGVGVCVWVRARVCVCVCVFRCVFAYSPHTRNLVRQFGWHMESV